MGTSTGRLRLAPDEESDGAPETKERPRSIPVASTTGAGPGRHSTSTKVPTMAKSTRGPSPSDRVTRISGVKITPLARMVPVPSISHTA
jgi:hypothetical protein